MSILKIALMTLIGLVVLAAVLHAWSFARFQGTAGDLARQVREGPAPVAGRDLPPAVRALAERNGADPAAGHRSVRLAQAAEFRRGPEAPWGAMPAVQHMGLGTAAFVWNARAPGPLVPGFTVIDAFVDGRGLLKANLLGSIPVAHAVGPVYDRAEAMRYLAELPWVPDAILGNPDLIWTVREDRTIEVGLETAAGPVSVRFALNDDGDMAEMTAQRPDLGADGREFTRGWVGRYDGYDWIGGRRIPLRGEVGYVEDGRYWPYWRGEITGLDLLR